MSAVWAATALQTGRFTGFQRHTPVEELAGRLEELRIRGQGYLEVRLPGGGFPCLALGFQGDHAVIHLFGDSGGSSLHVGDGTAAPDAEVEVVITDEPAVFTGDFVLSLDHAWGVVRTFLHAGTPGELDEWYGL